MLKLDERDLKIISILREEGRISKAALAERVNLTAAPCWERLKRLEEAGIITGYHAEVSLKKIAGHVVDLHGGRTGASTAPKTSRPSSAACRSSTRSCRAGPSAAASTTSCRSSRATSIPISGWSTICSAPASGSARYFTYVVTKPVKLSATPAAGPSAPASAMRRRIARPQPRRGRRNICSRAREAKGNIRRRRPRYLIRGNTRHQEDFAHVVARHASEDRSLSELDDPRSCLARIRLYRRLPGRLARPGDFIDVTDPANGSRVGYVPALGAAKPRKAVEAADAASPRWCALLPQERSAILRALVRPDDRRPRRPRAADDRWSRASRSPKRAARSTTPPPSSSFTPRRPSA